MNVSVCTTFAKMLRCVSIAPFGAPVVPPVYCSTATSSGAIGTRVIGAWPEPDARSAKVSAPSIRGGGAPSDEYSAIDVTMMCSIRVCAAMDDTTGAIASSVTTMRTPESTAMVSSSRAV